MSPNHSKRALRLIWCLMLGVSLIACSPAPPAGIVDVEPPGDLAELDLTVQEQFDMTWSALHGELRSSRQLGVAWGRMGQWFDVYRYDDSADQCYANARLLDPGEARWPYYQGIIALERGQLDLAVERFSVAAELAPDVPGPLVQLGDLALANAQVDRAESRYREALSLDADNPQALFGAARVALERGSPTQARDALEHLLTLQPNASEAHYLLATAWRQLGDMKRAAAHMGNVPEDNNDQVGLAQNDPWIGELNALNQGAVALTRRAVLAAKRGGRADAVLLFGRATIADPTGPDKRINYAKSLIAIDEIAGAVDQLQKALVLSKDIPESAARAHLALASLYATRGKPKLAEAHLRATLDIDPLSAEAHLQLGRLYQSRGNHEGALAEYAIVREMANANTEVYFWHAAMLVMLKRPEDAQVALREAIGRLGDDPNLRRLLSRIIVTASDPGPDDLARARQLLGEENKPDVFFAETASMIAAAEGRFDEAQAWQRAAIEVLDRDRDRLSAQIARRRLVLYRQQQPCQNPWEVTERVNFRKISQSPTLAQGIK